MVYNYLIKEGIEPERLTYVGYGETLLNFRYFQI